MIITELAIGSVERLIKNSMYSRDKDKFISIKQKMNYAKDTALGMNWLHCSKPPILHLNLKASNLLVSREKFL